MFDGDDTVPAYAAFRHEVDRHNSNVSTTMRVDKVTRFVDVSSNVAVTKTRTSFFVTSGHRGAGDPGDLYPPSNYRALYLKLAVVQPGKAFGLAISRSRVQILLEETPRNNLWQVVYTYVPLSPSSITWYRPKGGDALRLGRSLQAWRKVVAAYRRVDDLRSPAG